MLCFFYFFAKNHYDYYLLRAFASLSLANGFLCLIYCCALQNIVIEAILGGKKCTRPSLITTRIRSMGQVMFYTCLSFCSQGGLHSHNAIGQADTPLARRQTPPHGQEPTPLRRQTPRRQTVNRRVVRMLL